MLPAEAASPVGLGRSVSRDAFVNSFGPLLPLHKVQVTPERVFNKHFVSQ